MPFCRLATACIGHDLFTREEQAEAFESAYKELPVITTMLRGLDNFKEVSYASGRIRRMPGIVCPCSFELQRRRVHDFTIGIEGFMHKPMHTGMTADGIFAGPPLDVFASGIPLVELAQPSN